MTPENGSREEYDSLDRLNWSRLKLIERSPAHFRYGHGEDSSGFKLGTAAHMAILEPEKFASHYVIWTGKRRYGKVWDAFEMEQLKAGKEVLSQTEYDETLQIRTAVQRHAKASSYLRGGKSEVTLMWELGPFKCKGRADYISEQAIIDLKSTKDASPKAFATSCVRYGYVGQAAWYSDGAFLAEKLRLPYVIIAVEKTPPFLVMVYRITPETIAAGREQYLSLLGRLDYCQKNDFWGGYSQADELDLELPSWSALAAPSEDT